MKHFYTHLVEWQSIYESLDAMDLSGQEKAELIELAEGSMHAEVLDAVMEELDERDREMFVNLLKESDHSKVWEFLDKRVLNIEVKIKEVASGHKTRLHEDIVMSLEYQSLEVAKK